MDEGESLYGTAGGAVTVQPAGLWTGGQQKSCLLKAARQRPPCSRGRQAAAGTADPCGPRSQGRFPQRRLFPGA